MSIEMSKATNTNSSKENDRIMNLNLQATPPLILLLEGVFVICQYKEGDLSSIWFLDDDSKWKEITPLEKYLSINKSIPDKKTTTVVFIATYPPRGLQNIEKQAIESQHSFISSLLHKTESEVEHSIDLRYLLALLEFPTLKIEKHPHSLLVPKSLIPTEGPASGKASPTSTSVVNKVVNAIRAKTSIFTKPTAPQEAQTKPLEAHPIPEKPTEVKTVLSEPVGSTQESPEPVLTKEVPSKPTESKPEPIHPEKETVSVPNAKINGNESQKEESPTQKKSDSQQARPTETLLAKSPSNSDVDTQGIEEKTSAASSKEEEEPELSKEVTVTRTEWIFSKQGTLIPTIHFRPIKIGNCEFSKITGYNIGFLKRHGIGTGSVIKVGISGLNECKTLKFLGTITRREPSWPHVAKLKRVGVQYFWTDETISEAKRNIKNFLIGMGIENPTEISQAIVEDLGIPNASQLLAALHERGSKMRFKDSIQTAGVSGEQIYNDILRAINKPLAWEQLIIASSSFEINEIGEHLIDKLFDSKTVTIADLLGMQQKRISFELLKSLGFNRAKISLLLKGMGKFHDWWNENRKYFAQNEPLPKPTPLRKTLDITVAIPSNDNKIKHALKKLGVPIVQKRNADQIIAKDEDELQKLRFDYSNVILFDDFLDELRDNEEIESI